jgi:hypothetical protein
MARTTQQGRFRREPGAAPDVQGSTASTGAVVVSADAVEHAIRHTSLRALGFVGMLGIALIHLLDVVGKIQETPYLGVMYIALMVASVAVAFFLLHTGSVLAWATGGLLAVLTLIGFILSRTSGLPSATGDIGNWTEPLGLASMFVEGAVILLAGYASTLARNERHPGTHDALPVSVERRGAG